jgi:hypothetical protein
MYIGSASLGFSPFDRYARPPVPIYDAMCLMYIVSVSGENPSKAEPMYIKHSVSLIGRGGLTYLSKGENPKEAEPMYIKYSVSLIGTGGLAYLMIHCA